MDLDLISVQPRGAAERLIVALDFPDQSEALRLVEKLVGEIPSFKVGMELFTAAGPEVVRKIVDLGGRVFLDLKFHDIPNTVAGAARSAVGLGLWMFNMHVAGGPEMMRAAVTAVREAARARNERPPLLVGVTVLTSIDDGLWRDRLGFGPSAVAAVRHLALMAQEAGLDGVVASPQEIRAVKEACGPEFLTVTPGIRPQDASHGDQRRTMTPGEAAALGSDYLVVGRPITAAADPVAAARRTVAEISQR